MLQYNVFCRRSERLSLEAMIAIAPAGMTVRAAQGLDGFVFDAPEFALGAFICDQATLERHRSHFRVEGTPPPPGLRNPFLSQPLPADLFERVTTSQMLLDVSFLRGNHGDTRGEEIITKLLHHVDGVIERGSKFFDAQGTELWPREKKAVPVDITSCTPRLMRSILEEWNDRAGGQIYVPVGSEITPDTEVRMKRAGERMPRVHQGYECLLGMEKVGDVVESLEYAFVRQATIEERLRAVLHYAEYDAFIDPDELAR